MSTQTLKRSEAGFTLVELAIVMVIIGLLIGGVLKGQELITSARVSSTVTQIKSLDAAMNTFQDKYNVLPGDMTNVDTRLAGGLTAESGNGNGALNSVLGAAPVANGEGTLAFVQMSRADLMSGINVSGGFVFSGLLPSTPIGGGMFLGTSSATGQATGATGLFSNRIYVAVNGVVGAVSRTSGNIPVVNTAQIDRKLDDGIPTGGATRAVCATGGTNANGYVEDATSSCAMYIRAMN